jgi:AcrR family transcriptional regulator
MPARRPRPDSRQAILDAAAREFAAHGYSGAGVDRIARRAGVNKAMIYYHFASKSGLYQAILHEVFAAAGERFRAIAAAGGDPGRALDALLEAFLAEAGARPHLAPILLRELAEGGAHLDAATLRAMSAPYDAFRRFVEAGVQARRLEPVHPLLAYFTLVGPVLLYLGNAPVRRRMRQAGLVNTAGTEAEAFLRHLQRATRRALLADEVPAAGPLRAAPPRAAGGPRR